MNDAKNQSILKYYSIILILVMIAQGTGAYTVYKQYRTMIGQETQVNRTRSVLSNIVQLQGAIAQQRAHFQSFMLLDKTDALNRFEESVIHTNVLLRVLSNLTVDNQDQYVRVQKIINLQDRFYVSLESLKNAFGQSGFNSEDKKLEPTMTRSREIVLTLLEKLDEVQVAEEYQLKQHLNTSSVADINLKNMIIFAYFFNIFLAISIFLILRKSTQSEGLNRFRQLKLKELSKTLSTEGLLENYPNMIAEHLCHSLDAQVANVWFVDKESLILKGTFGFKNELHNVKFPLKDGIYPKVLQNKKSLKYAPTKEGFVSVSSSFGSHPPVSILIIPIENKENVTAIIEVGFLRNVEDEWLKFADESSDIFAAAFVSYNLRIAEQKILQKYLVQKQDLEKQSVILEKTNTDLANANKENEVKVENLKKINQYKSDFLANMSHELRTPLNSILILSELLKGNKKKSFAPQDVEFLDVIHNSGQDLLTLIDDILDLAKVEAQKLKLNVSEFDLLKVLNQLAAKLSPQALKKGIGFALDTSRLVNNFIKSDPQRIEQILRNFLSNSFKFTLTGGVILYAETVVKRSEKFLRIGVKDTGIGISKDNIKPIFESFHQGDGSISRRFGGTGLGLTIVREMVHLLGGKIEVSSVLGEGSDFTLVLPLDNAQQAPISIVFPTVNTELLTAIQTKTPRYNAKILVADDDHRNIFSLTAALELEGFEVLAVADGKSAVEAIENDNSIDVVLMDIMMPIMDGLEATALIRSKRNKDSLPILILSAKTLEHDKERALEAGANEHISKPISIHHLKSRLLELLPSKKS